LKNIKVDGENPYEGKTFQRILMCDNNYQKAKEGANNKKLNNTLIYSGFQVGITHINRLNNNIRDLYKKIGDLIDTGNASLQMLQSIDPDVTNPQLIAATGTLLNSIRGCISEFTKIHQQWIRFQQTLKFEKIKQENKKELIKFRKAVSTGTLENEQQVSELFELGSTDLIEFLQWKKEKEAKEKEKNEKM